jgi:8-oxo-dGTP pyrophosphatase MutT (NUDIX family)
MSNLQVNNTIGNTQTIVAKKFSLKHSFRAGAIVWVKDRKTNKDYYAVFKSHSRPTRGVQLPGGRVEKLENVADTVVREVEEEIGLKTKILCPLGFIYLNNPSKDYSRVEIYYIVRPINSVDIHSRWQHIDKDKSQQNLECWFVHADKPPMFLASGQDMAVGMFQQWLKEHARTNLNHISAQEQTAYTTNYPKYKNRYQNNKKKPFNSYSPTISKDDLTQIIDMKNKYINMKNRKFK